MDLIVFSGYCAALSTFIHLHSVVEFPSRLQFDIQRKLVMDIDDLSLTFLQNIIPLNAKLMYAETYNMQQQVYLCVIDTQDEYKYNKTKDWALFQNADLASVSLVR